MEAVWKGNNMKYSAVIFDLDGVLCSTDEYHYQAWKQIAKQLCIPFDRHLNHRLRGISRAESLEILLIHGGMTLPAAAKSRLLQQKNSLYREMLSQMQPDDLSPQTVTTLEKLKSADIPMAVASSSENAAFIMERLKIWHFITALVSGCDIRRSKPDPEVFLLAAQRLGLSPEACLVVEDAAAGVQAACAGGFACVALGDGAGERAAWRIDELPQILPIVLGYHI